MLTLPPAVRIFLCVQPVDMRRSFDGLAALVQDVLKQDPFSGHLFVFRGKRADRVKLLYWDTDGYAIWYKRLETGTFRFPEDLADGAQIALADLALLLDGIDPRQIVRPRRYVRRTLEAAGAGG
jgi:transposase